MKDRRLDFFPVHEQTEDAEEDVGDGTNPNRDSTCLGESSGGPLLKLCVGWKDLEVKDEG